MEVIYFGIFLMIMSLISFIGMKHDQRTEKKELTRILAWNAAKSAEEKLKTYELSDSLSNNLDNYLHRYYHPIV